MQKYLSTEAGNAGISKIFTFVRDDILTGQQSSNIPPVYLKLFTSNSPIYLRCYLLHGRSPSAQLKLHRATLPIQQLALMSSQVSADWCEKCGDMYCSERPDEDWKKSVQYQPYRTSPLVSPTPRTVNEAGQSYSQYQQWRGPQYRPSPRQQHKVDNQSSLKFVLKQAINPRSKFSHVVFF